MFRDVRLYRVGEFFKEQCLVHFAFFLGSGQEKEV
jgi:hypothetical protein